MAQGYIVSGEVVEDDGRVIFDVYSDDQPDVLKRGVISPEALEVLNGGTYEDAADVFDEYRDKVASVAGDHWNANPSNEIIILGRGAF